MHHGGWLSFVWPWMLIYDERFTPVLDIQERTISSGQNQLSTVFLTIVCFSDKTILDTLDWTKEKAKKAPHKLFKSQSSELSTPHESRNIKKTFALRDVETRGAQAQEHI